jgi:maltose alpha-D-glucosyltransferase/alpha-amylase
MGETPFPMISSLPYQITLGPYMFLWFRLEKLAPGRGMP